MANVLDPSGSGCQAKSLFYEENDKNFFDWGIYPNERRRLQPYVLDQPRLGTSPMPSLIVMS